jgi:hypothetical protein
MTYFVYFQYGKTPFELKEELENQQKVDIKILDILAGIRTRLIAVAAQRDSHLRTNVHTSGVHLNSSQPPCLSCYIFRGENVIYDEGTFDEGKKNCFKRLC